MGSLAHSITSCHATCSMRATICRNNGSVKWLSGESHDDVPGMPDEASARLELPLLDLVRDYS